MVKANFSCYTWTRQSFPVPNLIKVKIRKQIHTKKNNIQQKHDMVIFSIAICETGLE